METYRGTPNNPILLYHLLPTKLVSEDFEADLLAETRHQGHNIRINKYSNGMTTINCALLIRKDQQATNGVVHLISNVLDPSVGVLSNVADMVLNDGRFTVMADILEKSGYINVLRTMQNSITILAPSDEAFQKLPESRREKIISDREARLALLQNHVIPHVICESAITGEHKVRTVSDNKLGFSCDIEGAYVEQTKLRGNFNLGKNGVIHMIDDVLLPDRAKNLLELAESRNLYTFVDLVKKAGLEETLSHTGDYTFFVPDEAAWYALDSQVLSDARRDLDLAGQLVRFHGAYGRHLTNAITDNQAIMSLNEEDPVRLQVWRRALGVEDARITEKDIEAQNGVIHIINKVITPSNRSLADVLRSIPGHTFNTFLSAVDTVSGQVDSLLNLGPGDETFYTFFVPTDSAFRSLDQRTRQRLEDDTEYQRDLVRQHVAVNMFPSTSFEKKLVYTVNGMAGPFDVKKTTNNVLTVNGEDVTSSHLSANGVIHVIDKVFLPGQSYSYYSESRDMSTTYYGGGRRTSSSRKSSSKRTYEKTVTFSENHGGGSLHPDDQLPGYPQGTLASTATSTTAKRKTNFRGSSRNRNTSPGGSYISTSSSASLEDGKRGIGFDQGSTTLEKTHLQGTGFSPRESETTDNSLDTSPSSSFPSSEARDPYDLPEPDSSPEPGLRDNDSSSSFSSSHSNVQTPTRHAEGSYTVREGSYSSPSYTPSSGSSSPRTYSTFSGSANTQETKAEHDGESDTHHQGGTTTSSRHHDTDLYRGSTVVAKVYNSSITRNTLGGAGEQGWGHSVTERPSDSTFSGRTSYSSQSGVMGGSGQGGYYGGSGQYGGEQSSSSRSVGGSGHSGSWTSDGASRYSGGSGDSRSRYHGSVSSTGGASLSGAADVSGSTGFTGGGGFGVGGTRRVTTSSRTYSYNYTSTGPKGVMSRNDGSLLPPSQFGLNSSASSSSRNNTVGPVSPGGGRFSYVGHTYGQDVVGHNQAETGSVRPSPLPFSLGDGGLSSRTHYYNEASRVDGGAGGYGGPTRGGVAQGAVRRSGARNSYGRNTERRRHDVRRQMVRGPAVQPLPQPVSLSSVAAGEMYADDRMYADGAEFAEAQQGEEEFISRQKAAAKRRRMRRKRHHKRGKNGKKRQGRRLGRRQRSGAHQQ